MHSIGEAGGRRHDVIVIGSTTVATRLCAHETDVTGSALRCSTRQYLGTSAA